MVPLPPPKPAIHQPHVRLKPPSMPPTHQVRVVEAEAAASPHSLAGLVGPLQLGGRAAVAMPHDLLGLADNAEALIAFMQVGWGPSLGLGVGLMT